MIAPSEVLELVKRFSDNVEAYKSGKYNETQIRLEFINPLFIALGWDVRNENGYAEAYKDVIHEDAIKIGGYTKAPDYCFRIGGTRKFFLEAKKPSVNLKQDINPAHQLRRYAWSAKLPLSILTDFEEFAVYDCRIKPLQNDKSSVARIMYIDFKEYPKRWKEIHSVFSRDAILKGSFDKFAQTSKGKRGTAEVDSAFLSEIETWRSLLAKNIAIKNPSLNQHELNFAVQRTIDRIIFLRICEDRGVEQYGRLLALQNSNKTYPALLELFKKADDRYNSGIFHFDKEEGMPDSPDELTPNLKLDDKPLKDIIKRLYFPQSPYEFSVLPTEILGQVYEQFLGKVIRLTKGHHAIVEDKPEVKKAGGVYYTPSYIVDYIVKNTVGKLLEGKTPNKVSKLKVLDPACGSGSFLIGVYNYLIDWHRNYYIDKGVEKHKKVLYQAQGGEWRLTTAEKKRILLNNIYGVDIDSQAVEVTKLSLLLKVLEGESDETINTTMQLFHERVLPDLGNNIKCGNSLIGPDYYDNRQMSLMDDEERYRVNAFDWKAEFPSVFARSEATWQSQSSGFDAVIGNPPYVRQESLVNLKKYFSKHFETYHGVADLYVYFIEKAVSLLKTGGVMSYIVANKWLRANYGKSLRIWMKPKRLEEIVDFGDLPVFQKATTYPCIIRISKNVPAAIFKAVKVKALKPSTVEEYIDKNKFDVKISSLSDGGWSLVGQDTQSLITELQQKGISLGEYTKKKIFRGVLTGFNKAFVISSEERQELINKDPKSKDLIKPFLFGRDIKRYAQPTAKNYVIFTRRGIDIKKYLAVENYLSKFKSQLMPKPKDWPLGKKWEGRKPGSYEWYEIQDTVAYHSELEKPKIIYPNICKQPEFTLDKQKLYTNQKCFIISIDDRYLLGLLNSSLTYFLFEAILPKLRGGFYEPSYIFLKTFPIYKIDFSNSAEKAMHDQMVNLVDNMLELHKRLSAAKISTDKTAIQRQITAADNQIDQLVYKLYGLTEKEIGIIEDSVQ